MSRSHRYHPYGPITTAISDKPFKKQENQAKRKKVSMVLRSFDPSDDKDIEAVLPHEKEFGNPWLSIKDGKTTYYDEADLRKMIDSTLKSFMNDSCGKEHYAYCLRNTWHSAWLIEKLCKFAEIEKDWDDITVDEIMEIPRETIDKFIVKEAKESLKK